MSHPTAFFENPPFETLLDRLREHTSEVDRSGTWPGEQLDWLARAGVLGWVIPEEYGGRGITAIELTRGYQLLGSACLTTTFVLTQRNGACQRIAGSENESLKANLLPRLATGELFATVGISHLTTSRQHLAKPAVAVTEVDEGFQLDGLIPWVTGAGPADHVVGGGTLDDGRQILAAIPTEAEGVEALPPGQLMSLNGSQTGPMQLDAVRIDASQVVAGPVEAVMKSGTGGGAGSVMTSALALGATDGALSSLGDEAVRRVDLEDSHGSLVAERDALESDLYQLVTDGEECGLTAAEIRRRANSLVLRSTQALLTATKGAGYVAGHPAERAVREAMFFLVWSCPQPVMQAALAEFACLGV